MARSPKSSSKASKQVDTLTHRQAKRKNIPTAELSSAAERMEEMAPFEPVTYERRYPLAEGETRERDGDLDPQIVWKGAKIHLTPDQIEHLLETGTVDIGEAQLTWRGKDTQDWSDLVVQAPPLYIQEKVHPKAIIEDLKRQSEKRAKAKAVEDGADTPDMFDLFHDFNGIDPEAKTEFYQHDQNWQNRMILGDSLQVMASLAERENLRGKVQCIYFDPPYGIKFNSNWQVSTRSRDVKDGKLDQITREPEQVKAFRDTWKDGIHSYLTYLRDRLTAMRDLLTDSGSIFVQIGDENVHRVRALMDEVFGEENFCSLIQIQKTGSQASALLANTVDFIVWYARKKENVKYRKLYNIRKPGHVSSDRYDQIELEVGIDRRLNKEEIQRKVDLPNGRIFQHTSLLSAGAGSENQLFAFEGKTYEPTSGNHWKTPPDGLSVLAKASRIYQSGNGLRYKRYLDDFPLLPINDRWESMQLGTGLVYVVQTSPQSIARCILMATDPGDLVLDPTCGSGTTATVAEQWGRRWITIDTSRVSLALARTRLMGARYPYYLLADSKEGRAKEAALTGQMQPDTPTYGDIRQGFVFERAPHITLKSIANNAEIDVIWEEYQAKLEPLREKLNKALGTAWEEWEIPRDPGEDWSPEALLTHETWWALRIERQKEIDASIARKADVEYLCDRPYEDKGKVRVAGPFTVESLSPHRVMPGDEEELIHTVNAAEGNADAFASGASKPDTLNDFTATILENLKSAGVHQATKEDRITFTSIDGWPGTYIAAEGHYVEGSVEKAESVSGKGEKRAAIFVGPEFGTVTRADLTAAAREANEARFDILIACGFNFDAHSSELTRMGPLPILKAKMNQDLHMSDELKNTGKGNLFTVIGEPDIAWKLNDEGEIVVEVLGLDVFDLKTGDVRSSEKDDIAAWFIDTDYDEESFFVRHAYFLGANDPYKALKTSLKAEIDQDAWETLYRDTSRPFPKPDTGRFAVKVINHFGDEVMKVFGV